MAKIKKAVAVVIEDDRGRIFLTKRSEHSRDQKGKWENPGGEIDGNETSEKAILREVKEELGVKVELNKTLYKDVFPTDEGVEWEVTIFSGTLRGEPSIQNYKETAEIGWFKKEELKDLPLASYTRSDFVRFGWIKK